MTDKQLKVLWQRKLKNAKSLLIKQGKLSKDVYSESYNDLIKSGIAKCESVLKALDKKLKSK